jgi:hypothetical protein
MDDTAQSVKPLVAPPNIDTPGVDGLLPVDEVSVVGLEFTFGAEGGSRAESGCNKNKLEISNDTL